MNSWISIGGTLGLTLSVVMSGCGGRDPDDPTPFQSDSAGIPIIEYGEALPPNVGRWSLAPEPITEIGDTTRGAEHRLRRPGWVGRTRGGDVVVATADSAPFRVFDSTGTFRRSIGKRGTGVGEVEDPSFLHLDQFDSLRIVDRRRKRIVVIDIAGGSSREVTIPSEGTAPARPRGWLADGSLVFDRDAGRRFAGVTGTFRDTVRLNRLGPDGVVRGELGPFLGSRFLAVEVRGSGFGGLAPFTNNFMVASGDSAIYVSHPDRYEIRVYGVDSHLRRLIRRRSRPVRVTDSAIKALERARPDSVYATWVRRAKFPKYYPSHGEIRTDRAGNLWVKEYPTSDGPGSPYPWLVFTSDGRLLAEADLTAAGFEPTEIGTDYVAGLRGVGGRPVRALVFRLRKER